MTSLASALAPFGIAVPAGPDLVRAGVALALALAALATGWLAGRRVGPWVAQLWQARVGHHVEGLATRMCSIVRHGTAALLLAVILKADRWDGLAAGGLAFALAAAVAMTVLEVLRGLSLPRWAAWATATPAVAP